MVRLIGQSRVSHPRLERIRELVDYADIGWTKLTGAGGGGCAITILRSDAEEEKLHELMAKLDEENFERYEIVLGGDGVGVLWPAVLHNGSEEEGGEEIDQQKFENAIDNDGIEQLVGVDVYEKRDSWKFCLVWFPVVVVLNLRRILIDLSLH